MSQLTKIDNEYKEWIAEVSKRFRQSQIKAAVKVNQEMLAFYWSLGKDISSLQAESRWGSGFIDALSQDLQQAIPDAKGLSPTNLRYIRRFYELYAGSIQAQVVPESIGSVDSAIRAQVVPEITLEELFSLPWGHHRNIIVKCSEDPQKAVFFVKAAIRNGWSRAVLLNFLDTNLY